MISGFFRLTWRSDSITGRAGRNTNEFFLSGRNAPWWLAGTSMVATTFAADTPLAVTGMVARNGFAGNWLWWNAVPSGMRPARLDATFALLEHFWTTRCSGAMVTLPLRQKVAPGQTAVERHEWRS